MIVTIQLGLQVSTIPGVRQELWQFFEVLDVLPWFYSLKSGGCQDLLGVLG